MSDHFVLYQGWSLTREVTVVKFRAQKVTGTLETCLSIGPDRMTPCNPIPNVTSFSDSKGLIRSGPIVVLFKSFSLINVIIFFSQSNVTFLVGNYSDLFFVDHQGVLRTGRNITQQDVGSHTIEVRPCSQNMPTYLALFIEAAPRALFLFWKYSLDKSNKIFTWLKKKLSDQLHNI